MPRNRLTLTQLMAAQRREARLRQADTPNLAKPGGQAASSHDSAQANNRVAADLGEAHALHAVQIDGPLDFTGWQEGQPRHRLPFGEDGVWCGVALEH